MMTAAITSSSMPWATVGVPELSLEAEGECREGCECSGDGEDANLDPGHADTGKARGLLIAAADTGITSTLFMEADVEDWRAETGMVLEMVDDPDTIMSGVIANCRLEDPGFDAWLDTIADRPVVGLRRILHVMPNELSKDDAFRANIRKLSGHGLTFDLCFLGRQLAIAAELARACENVQFVLDHCGVPDIASGAMDPLARADPEPCGLCPTWPARSQG